MRSKPDAGLRSIFRKNLPKIDWQPIESPLTGGGIPDSNGCAGPNTEFWIEFKQTDGWLVKFEPEQPAWIYRRYRHGGRVWIAIRRWHDGGPRIGLPVDDLYLIYGGHVLELVQSGLRIEEQFVTGHWRGGPSRWDWDAVGRLLVGTGGGTRVTLSGNTPPTCTVAAAPQEE